MTTQRCTMPCDGSRKPRGNPRPGHPQPGYPRLKALVLLTSALLAVDFCALPVQVASASTEASPGALRTLTDDSGSATLAQHASTQGPPGDAPTLSSEPANARPTDASATGSALNSGAGGSTTTTGNASGTVSGESQPVAGAPAPALGASTAGGGGSSALVGSALERSGDRGPRSAEPAPALAIRPGRSAPAWESLNPGQQHWLSPLAKVWHELPVSDRQTWLQLSRQLPRLPEEAQAQAKERMQQWSAFTPQQRQAARENFRLAQKLKESNLTQGQLQALWDRYQELTPEQRAVLRAAGQTATTAARHAGAATPLAKETSRPLPQTDRNSRTAQ